MIKNTRTFLSKIIVAVFCVTLSFSAIAATDIPTTNNGNLESWITEHNRDVFMNTLVGDRGDLVEFQSEFQKQIIRDYVPPEAHVGIALMNGLNYVAKTLDSSLVRFMVIFIMIMYAFWIALEAYNTMTTDSNVEKLITNIAKKSIFLIIWICVLEIGPGKLFMIIAGPIISLGTYLANFILNAITQTAGIVIPDTCNAIREYTIANVPNDMIISANAAADMICLPTRLSSFFTTAMSAGWQWMIAGIGHSIFTFTMGVVFLVLFAWNAWKFTLMALSVIMNLFLCVLLMPFTALAETIPQTSYKGPVGNIFNSFMKIFNVGPVKLDKQIETFINATIYFVTLSIVIAICAALLSGVVHTNLASDIPTLENNGFIPTLLTGALVAWLAGRADKVARDLGGSPQDGDTGKQITADIQKLAKDTYETAKSWAKAFADSRK